MADSTYSISSREAVVEALHIPELVPPPRPGPGATLDLRRRMARFSNSRFHEARRSEVDEAVDSVDLAVAVAATRAEARRRLAGGQSGESVAMTCPVAGLAVGLGIVDPGDRSAIDGLVVDVVAVVEVIGRGAEPSPGADDATDRLIALCGGGPASDPLACVSLLYQTMDATAALIRAVRAAEHAGVPRIPAVQRTMRMATTKTNVEDITMNSGEIVTIEIGAVGLEFGAGPHACPGRELAEALAAAVVEELS